MPNFDILALGEINPDLILAGDDLEVRFGQQETLVDQAELAIGSSAAIFICGARRLGLKSAIGGVVGADLFGHFMLEALKERGVDSSPVIVDPQEKTGLTVILSRGTDRAILTYLGAMEALRAEQIGDELLSQARHLHVTSYFLQTRLQPGLPDLLRRARALGLTISLDTNWDPRSQWWKVREVLPLVDVFLPNEVEAVQVSGEANLDAAMTRLIESVAVVAVKRGELGAVGRTREAAASASALKVKVADTVGAGDSFDAGFLYGYLQGWPLERSLALGAVCGSLSTREHGGTQAQPTLEEALRALEIG